MWPCTSACEYLVTLTDNETHRHANILWFRQAHQHAVIFLFRQTHQQLASYIILWVRHTHRHAPDSETHQQCSDQKNCAVSRPLMREWIENSLWAKAHPHLLNHFSPTCIIAYWPSRYQSMCDICFCILLAGKSQHFTIAHRPSRHQSMCDSCFCILLARKSQHASSHIDRVDTSRCAISVLYLAWKSQHFTIANRPSRYTAARIMHHGTCLMCVHCSQQESWTYTS